MGRNSLGSPLEGKIDVLERAGGIVSLGDGPVELRVGDSTQWVVDVPPTDG